MDGRGHDTIVGGDGAAAGTNYLGYNQVNVTVNGGTTTTAAGS